MVNFKDENWEIVIDEESKTGTETFSITQKENIEILMNRIIYKIEELMSCLFVIMFLMVILMALIAWR